jgi:hypothetical protein
VAAEWFVQRRDADGRPHDPRAAKRLSEQAAAAAGGLLRDGRGRAVRGPAPGEDDELMRLMRAAAVSAAAPAPAPAPPGQRRQQPGAAGEGAAAPQQQAPARRVAVTAREMAAMRSSLPSPRKFKGAKLAQELEIKQSGESSCVWGTGLGWAAVTIAT